MVAGDNGSVLIVNGQLANDLVSPVLSDKALDPTRCKN